MLGVFGVASGAREGGCKGEKAEGMGGSGGEGHDGRDDMSPAYIWRPRVYIPHT